MSSADTESMNITAFWDTAPCSLAEVDGRFSGALVFHRQHPNDGFSMHL
jgi:hypothetical protein